MKNRSIVALAIVAVAGLAANAMADGRVNLSATPTGSGGRYDGTDGSGGAFLATVRGDFHANQADPGYNGVVGGNGLSVASNSFYTFCMERNEYLDSPQYTQISTSSSGGGISGQDGSESDGNGGFRTTDSLSPTTAKIYQEFRNNGTFGSIIAAGGIEGMSDVNAAKALVSAIQHAIWFSEGELTSISGTDLAIYNWANTNNDGTIGNVRVLRMWDNHDAVTGRYWNNDGSGAQDQLTLIPLPPAGWAGLGSLAGVAAFGAIRRRKLAAV